ncbi:hypothetical protein TPA4_60 [Tsukamurella phage TPA4]|uniref:hypothetical protein n=1 Tax=Tsukamurella phage TPA4 TaxID=1647476 RepID=UPI0007B61988|nr:hypothetical protein BH784_gp60 [Tsukamurella phage TPA4]AKJ72225.1 hypothetical protein TPA4_60 [Tsukamurella phage TPA4]
MPETTTTRTTRVSGYGLLTLANLRQFVDATEGQWSEDAHVAITTQASRDQRDSATWQITLTETTRTGARR